MKIGPRPADINNQQQKDAYLKVFTTICPHLGCSVNSNAPAGFACPCHAATFLMDGKRAVPATNPAQRGMDTLAWDFDPEDPDHNRIRVTYMKFEANNARKIPIGGGPDEPANN